MHGCCCCCCCESDEIDEKEREGQIFGVKERRDDEMRASERVLCFEGLLSERELFCFCQKSL